MDEGERGRRVLGGVLVGAGALWLLVVLAPGTVGVGVIGPLVFIAVGSAFLMQRAGP